MKQQAGLGRGICSQAQYKAKRNAEQFHPLYFHQRLELTTPSIFPPTLLVVQY